MRSRLRSRLTGIGLIVVGVLLILGAVYQSLEGQSTVNQGRAYAGSQSTIFANEGATGTTLNKLAKLTGAPSTAIIVATTDTEGIVGIVVAGAGTTGNAQIAFAGKASCVFDSATTAGHYVINDTSTAGDCMDSGAATYPTSGQVVGIVTTTNGGAGTYEVDLTLRQPQAGGGAGALTLLEQHTAATSASLPFTAWYSASYDEYEIHLVDIAVATANGNLGIQVSTDGGANYDTGNNYNFSYSWSRINTGGDFGQDAQALMMLVNNESIDAHWPVVGRLNLYNPGGTVAYKRILGEVALRGQPADTPPVRFAISSAWKNTAAFNAFRVISSVGNIASGTVRVYGLSK